MVHIQYMFLNSMNTTIQFMVQFRNQDSYSLIMVSIFAKLIH